MLFDNKELVEIAQVAKTYGLNGHLSLKFDNSFSDDLLDEEIPVFLLIEGLPVPFKVSNKKSELAAAKKADEKARLEAETKVKEQRAEAIAKKRAEAMAALEAEAKAAAAEANADETAEAPAETPAE